MEELTISKTTYSSTIINVILCGLISVISVWAAYHGIADWSYRAQRGFWNLMGVLSLFSAIVSISLWFLKKKIINTKQRDRKGFAWANSSMIKRLRDAHVNLGWVAFTLGLGHGAFFMVNLPSRMNRVYSGVIALVGMIVLMLTGLMYRHKIISLKTSKTCHKVIACIFGVLLLVHI